MKRNHFTPNYIMKLEPRSFMLKAAENKSLAHALAKTRNLELNKAGYTA